MFQNKLLKMYAFKHLGLQSVNNMPEIFITKWNKSLILDLTGHNINPLTIS